MPVRMEDRRRPEKPPPPKRTFVGPPAVQIVLMVGIGLLLIVVVIVGVVSQQRQAATSPPGNNTTGGPTGVPANGELAPGVKLGTALVEGANSGTLDGTDIKIGFPRTEDGAVSAAFSYAAAWRDPGMFDSDVWPRINQRLYTEKGIETSGMDEDFARDLQQVFGLDEHGNPVDENGDPRPNAELVLAAYPRYGAYQVEHVYPSEEPEKAIVHVWFPHFSDVIENGDYSDAEFGWYDATVTLIWSNKINDWQVDYRRVEPEGTQPANRQVPNKSPEQISTALADAGAADWYVPADYAREPIPGTVELG